MKSFTWNVWYPITFCACLSISFESIFTSASVTTRKRHLDPPSSQSAFTSHLCWKGLPSGSAHSFISKKQEYIPVGCVPSAAVGGGLPSEGSCLLRGGLAFLEGVCLGVPAYSGVCLQGVWLRGFAQTGVKALPSLAVRKNCDENKTGTLKRRWCVSYINFSYLHFYCVF